MKAFFIILTSIAIIGWPFISRADFSDCSDGWEVTGYYVPSEADFSGTKQKINTVEEGIREFKSDFIEVVHTEGSGQSEAGEILEWYEDAWHINDKPEDYFGNELTLQTAAVDPAVIPFHTKLIIPTLQSPHNETIYTASDIGPSIKGKHIDVFMGYGKHALDAAWQFPDYNTVCLKSESVSAGEENNKISRAGNEAGIDLEFSKSLAGRILLQTEENGEAWYVYPGNNKRYYLGRPSDAFALMRQLGLGARHEFIAGHSFYPEYVLGKILIDVEDSGRAYYINPSDKEAYYLGRPSDAFRIMSGFGLGISEENINKIAIGEY